jgi:hypothetical protein
VPPNSRGQGQRVEMMRNETQSFREQLKSANFEWVPPWEVFENFFQTERAPRGERGYHRDMFHDNLAPIGSLVVAFGLRCDSSRSPKQTNRQAIRMPIETPIAVFLGLCCALFCLEAVVNPKSGSRGMKFQDHVSRASKFFTFQARWANFHISLIISCIFPHLPPIFI